MSQVSIDRLIIAAKSGNLISFPTDTVPALATLPASAGLIFAAKQRSQTKPLILMAGEVADLWQFTTGTEREIEIWRAVAANVTILRSGKRNRFAVWRRPRRFARGPKACGAARHGKSQAKGSSL